MRPGDDSAGFTLVDVVAVVGVLAVIAAMAVPAMLTGLDQMRLGQAAREVERELQSARQRAVANNRPIRVRFNCPTAGEYRAVELLGTPSAPAAADSTTDRCRVTLYPYPPATRDPMVRPQLDGPPRRLDSRVSFGSVETVEFWPDGTAHHNSGGVNPWPIIPAEGIKLTLTMGNTIRTIRVNGLGRILLER